MGKRRKSRSVKPRKPSSRLVDPGPDEGGRYSPSPFLLQHGYAAEVAPRELRSNPDSSFPKRRIGERVIDRYKAQKHITPAEFSAADFLYAVWEQTHGVVRVTSGYDPVVVSSSGNPDGQIAKRMDAEVLVKSMLVDVPYRSRGCVRAVVIEDITAADWARRRGYRGHDVEGHGLTRLRAGLQALVAIFSY